MIVSHRHRFIFLKTTKTAGSALELALAAHCGPDDILTALGKDEREHIRQQHLPIPQNDRLPRAHWRAQDWLRWPWRGAPPRFTSHMSAAKVRAELGAEIWNGYFKFAVARNPWDRFLSLYHWHFRRPTRRHFAPLTPDAFIAHRRTTRLNELGHGVYCINGQLAVDHVCRYESLADELVFLQQRLGLDAPLVMPRTKHTSRGDRRPYQEVLTADAARRIGKIFAAEIALMGYSF